MQRIGIGALAERGKPQDTPYVGLLPFEAAHKIHLVIRGRDQHDATMRQQARQQVAVEVLPQRSARGFGLRLGAGADRIVAKDEVGA